MGDKSAGSGERYGYRPPRAAIDLASLEITHVRVPQDPPVQNCELCPFVLLRDGKGNQFSDIDQDILRFKWLRGQRRICALPRCNGGAKIQCLLCLKLKNASVYSFFCSGEHLAIAWKEHRKIHSVPRGLPEWIDDDAAMESSDAEDFRRVHCRFPPPLSNSWSEVATSRVYVPKIDDVGRMLRLEISASLPKGVLSLDGGSQSLGPYAATELSSVLPEPEAPPPRKMAYPARPDDPSKTFTVFSYNILAEIYANRRRYPYCPMWALLWTFRRNNILRELLNAKSDIIGLQEVQLDHFDDFLYPKMREHGYQGVYKAKTRPTLGDSLRQLDGCAIFYKEDKFALMEQYSIEYNEAAKEHIEQQLARQQRQGKNLGTTAQSYRTNALKRLTKGNIALVVVLEELGDGNPTRVWRRKRVCVANTHIFWDPEYSDVKLWQTLVLCQELEKLVLPRSLPLILLGDFNSTVNSAVYSFLLNGG